MNDKKFSFAVMAIFASLTFAVAAFNFWIDPLWHYGHAHGLNDVQIVADEREQKTAQQLYDRQMPIRCCLAVAVARMFSRRGLRNGLFIITPLPIYRCANIIRCCFMPLINIRIMSGF
ncbi:hypothetical protein BB777_05310 [Planococcus faecalis]|nr:hypothetical protein BB777_05310 [Planococcus faecalis]